MNNELEKAKSKPKTIEKVKFFRSLILKRSSNVKSKEFKNFISTNSAFF